MSLSYQQLYWLASLGLKTARAIQSGASQEPERHVPVSGQIRGYLRWYGDLTGSKGYWPLAETIASELQDGASSKHGLKSLTELFAGEWGCTPAQVREEMTETIFEAMTGHPDFAACVMGGTPQSKILPSFLEASVRWLKQYMLIQRYFAWGEQEAVWTRRNMRPQLDRRAPYISTEDYWLVSELHRGRSKEVLAQKLGCTVEDLVAQYQQTAERAQRIVSMLGGLPVPPKRPDWEISDYLEDMGLPPGEGQAELRAAIRLAQDKPDLLERMTEAFYPAVAGEIGRPVSTTSQQIRAAIDKLAKYPGNAELFRRGGMAGSGVVNVKRFIQTFLQYIGHEDDVDQS